MQIGEAYLKANYDFEIVIGNTRHSRRVSSVSESRIAGSATTYSPTSYSSGSKALIFPASNYRHIESVGSLYVQADGGYGGISSGDVVFVQVVSGVDRSIRLLNSQGQVITLTGSGNAANIQFRDTQIITEFNIDRALPSAPAANSDVFIIDGKRFSNTHPVVESSTAATTTVIPITQATWNAAVSNSHDVVIDNQHRDVSAVNNTARTITLSTALSAAPNPGDIVHVGTLDTDYEELTAIKHTSGNAATKETTIDYPFSHLKFRTVGGGANTNTYVQVAGANLPDMKQRI